MLGVAAFVNEALGGLMRGKNGYELLVLLVGFAEVGTESALSIVNCWHIALRDQFSCCKV